MLRAQICVEFAPQELYKWSVYREKLDALSRRTYNQGRMNFVADVALLLVDEVHLLCDDRGPTLEAGVVCRLRALGALPALAAAPLARLRVLAVSATIPNVRDVVAWLGVRPEGCKQFGEEMRPVQIATHVRGFSAAKNDFLFERSLNDRVFAVVQEHWAQKPVLTFCSSRKGALYSAHRVLPQPQGCSIDPSLPYFARGSLRLMPIVYCSTQECSPSA